MGREKHHPHPKQQTKNKSMKKTRKNSEIGKNNYPVLVKSHGRRSLVGCRPWGRDESDTTFPFTFHFHALEKEMATHSSVLAWRIPGTGIPSLGSHRVGYD